jgi:hypothetical protein
LHFCILGVHIACRLLTCCADWPRVFPLCRRSSRPAVSMSNRSGKFVITFVVLIKGLSEKFTNGLVLLEFWCAKGSGLTAYGRGAADAPPLAARAPSPPPAPSLSAHYAAQARQQGFQALVCIG